MNPIAVFAERALREHTHPALRLRELVELVAERVDRTLDGDRLRAVLETYPDRFRILDPWSGPWRSMLDEGPGAPGCDVWVIALTVPDHPPSGPPVAVKLRETVRWIGRGVDPRSPREVSRWYAIALAERALREAAARRAA